MFSTITNIFYSISNEFKLGDYCGRYRDTRYTEWDSARIEHSIFCILNKAKRLIDTWSKPQYIFNSNQHCGADFIPLPKRSLFK